MPLYSTRVISTIINILHDTCALCMCKPMYITVLNACHMQCRLFSGSICVYVSISTLAHTVMHIYYFILWLEWRSKAPPMDYTTYTCSNHQPRYSFPGSGSYTIAWEVIICSCIVNSVRTTGLQLGRYHSRGCTGIWAGCTWTHMVTPLSIMHLYN